MCALDHAGRPVHRRLHSLWQFVDESGHIVFIELARHAEGTKAGDMIVEKVDPSGGQHILCIRLFLSTINRAFAEKKLPHGTEMFVPFAGLGRVARYAQVLGHEFAHVERVCANADYLGMYTELDGLLRSYCSQRHIRKDLHIDCEEQQLLEKIDLLVAEIERPAAAAEAQI